MRSIRYKSKRNNILLIVILLVLFIGIGFAYLTQSLEIGTSAKIGKNTWNVYFENIITREGSVEGTSTIGSDKTSITSTVELNHPKEFYEIYVDIVNKGTIDARIESIVKTSLSDTQKKYLNYTVTYSDYVEINEKDLLKSGEKETIRILVEMKDVLDATSLPNTEENLTLNTKINYIQEDGEGVERSKNALYQQIVKETKPDTSINFGAISSDTNGKGVYTLSKTVNTAYPVYYYRGSVENNNVIFGNFCWKMIRTTDTGGIKLIYNGVPNNGTCNNTGDATEIGKSTYNTEQNDPKYVGYMYDNNTVNSTIKDTIDEWFSNNLIDYQDMLEDTPFYNERDYVAGVGFPMVFAPRQRIWGDRTNGYAETVPNTTVKLGATNVEDIFTVSSEIGNGKLTYPVGLLTSDEAILAGGRGWISDSDNGANTSYYLRTGSWYWTMSPASFYADSLASVLRVGFGGSVSDNLVGSVGGVHPVISLQPNTTYTSGNGTTNSPYNVA